VGRKFSKQPIFVLPALDLSGAEEFCYNLRLGTAIVRERTACASHDNGMRTESEGCSRTLRHPRRSSRWKNKDRFALAELPPHDILRRPDSSSRSPSRHRGC